MVLVPGRGQIAGDCCRGGFLFPEPLPLPVYSHTVVGLWAPGFDLGAGAGILGNEVLLGATGIMDGVWLQPYSWTPLRQTNCLFPPSRKHKSTQKPVHQCSQQHHLGELRSSQTTGYYSAMKTNEVLTRATTWMDFEDIKLS